MTTITSLTDRRARRARGAPARRRSSRPRPPASRRPGSELIDRYAVLIRSVCRSHRLCDADAEDVAQLTWLRAVEHIGRLRDPERFGAWVGTTARRECLRVLHGRKRVVPTADEVRNPLFAEHVDADEIALAAERRDGGAPGADATLPDRQRTLLRLLHSETRAELRGDRRDARDAGRQHRTDPRPRARAVAQRTPTRTRSAA